MKKKILLTLAFAALFASASFGQLKYGGGLTIGTKSAMDEDGEKMGFGINLRADYAINDKLSIAPGFTYFIPSSIEYSAGGYSVESKLSFWQLNADAHYVFTETGSIKLYGIGGLNYTSWKSTIETNYPAGYDDYGFSMDGEFTDSEIGLDLGVGANMGVFFGEVKYDTAVSDGQIGITVGVLFGGN